MYVLSGKLYIMSPHQEALAMLCYLQNIKNASQHHTLVSEILVRYPRYVKQNRNAMGLAKFIKLSDNISLMSM